MTMDEDSSFDNFNVLKNLIAPMDRTLVRLHETMAEITIERTMGVNIELCDHATSLIRKVASNIHRLHLIRINESMLSRMVFRKVDDGFGNSINHMKN